MRKEGLKVYKKGHLYGKGTLVWEKSWAPDVAKYEQSTTSTAVLSRYDNSSPTTFFPRKLSAK